MGEFHFFVGDTAADGIPFPLEADFVGEANERVLLGEVESAKEWCWY